MYYIVISQSTSVDSGTRVFLDETHKTAKEELKQAKIKQHQKVLSDFIDQLEVKIAVQKNLTTARCDV